jgi:GNAT superfamily N-acetyltransferase
MIISFQTTQCPTVEELQAFEMVYPKGLRLTGINKAKLLLKGLHFWIRADRKLVGEMLGFLGAEDEWEVPDILPTDFYIGKMAVLPKFQGQGLGKLLFARLLGRLMISSCQRVCWHSSSDQMDRLSDFFNSRIGPVHQDWFGTGRHATFRYLLL